MAKNEEILPPEWLDKDFIQTSLREGLKNEKLILHTCDISPANATGDHYGSQMFRVRSTVQKTGNGEKESFSFVIKSLPLGDIQKHMHEFAAFETEGRMFEKTLPEVHELLMKIYPDHEKLQAQCYFTQGRPNDLIFLEDLRLSGYTLGDRFNGLDLDHSVLVVKSLAKLHASSLILLEKEPQEKKAYDDYLWKEDHKDIMGNMLKNAIKSVADVTQNLEALPGKERYYSKLKNLEESILEKVYESYKRDEDRLNVILHGDCWTNNIMFRYEGGKLKGMKFVDFQLANYNSPVLDLIYFIFTSSKCRFSHLDFLLETYHKTFTETLNRLNYTLKKPFTFEIMKKEFNRRLFHGLSSVICILPITSCPPSEAPDINDMLAPEPENALRVYRHDGFTSVLKKALPFFEERGVLE